DRLAQPLVQLGEIAAFDLLVEARDRLPRLLPDLHREDRAEQVRGEVAEATAGPVRILQDAERVVRDGEAQQLLEPGVPGVREILDGKTAGQQLLLELEAEDHVQPVARLVGVDAHERAPDTIDRAVELLERHAAERTWERLLHARVEPAPERE